MEDFKDIAPETLEELTNGKAEPKGLQRVRASLARARSAIGAKRRAVSPLSKGSILSPNHYAGRAFKVTKVTIHEMAAVWTADRCGEWFKYQTGNASSNYGIGHDGKIMCYVEEHNAAWTSADWDNDNRAITIEVSNSYMGGDWPISDAAYRSLVALCADLHKQYGVPVVYKGYPADGHTEHKMFANTACPGPYIHNLLASGKLLNDIKKAMDGQEGELIVATQAEIDKIAAAVNSYVYGAEDKRANMNAYNTRRWTYNEVLDTKKKIDALDKRVTALEGKIDQVLAEVRRVWFYRNKKLEKGDTYQIIRDTRDATRRIDELDKKLDQVLKKLG